MSIRLGVYCFVLSVYRKNSMKKRREFSKRTRVAVLISPDLGVRREGLRGIYHYVSGQTDWELSLMWSGGLEIWKSLPSQPIAGALVWPNFEEELAHLKSLKVPVVTLGSLAHPGYPSVYFDNRAAAKLGVEELAAKGLKSVAFYAGRHWMLYSQERQEGYLDAVKHLGLNSSILQETATEPDWKRLETWLSNLPKPSGVLADTDTAGMHILTAARHQDIEIPDQLPLVSIGGDDLICPLVSPSLSSVVLPGFEVGVESARILDSLFKQIPPKASRQVITPQRMVERRSSHFFHVKDPHVAHALRHIRDHASERLTVPDVLAEVSLSRRPLEKRFRELTGKTIQKTIWKAKLDMARRLLWETSLSVAEISDACGFAEPQRLTEVFKRELGLSPKVFRQKFINGEKSDL